MAEEKKLGGLIGGKKAGQVLLHDFAARGEVNQIKELMAAADVNAVDVHGETALHRAAANNQTVAIRVLVENKARIDAANREGNTPLHKAAENGHSRAISVLFDLGANINYQNRMGETPLHSSARNNHGVAMHDLLTIGGNLQLKNKRGQTAKAVAKASHANDAIAAINEYYSKQSLFNRIKNMF